MTEDTLTGEGRAVQVRSRRLFPRHNEGHVRCDRHDDQGCKKTIRSLGQVEDHAEDNQALGYMADRKNTGN